MNIVAIIRSMKVYQKVLEFSYTLLRVLYCPTCFVVLASAKLGENDSKVNDHSCVLDRVVSSETKTFES